MTDLVKRLRLMCRVYTMKSSTRDCIAEAADEIERLQAECDALSKDCTTRYERHRKAVIEDMREWAKSKGYADHTASFPALDAYAKDRGIL